MKYNKSFKEEAVRLSDEISVKQAAQQLGLSYHTLSGWRRSKARYGENAYVGSGHRHKPNDSKEQRILDLEKELREVKRANEILKEAMGFFVESRRK